MLLFLESTIMALIAKETELDCLTKKDKSPPSQSNEYLQYISQLRDMWKKRKIFANNIFS